MTQKDPEDLKGRPVPAPPTERIANILADSLQDEYGSVSSHLSAIGDALHDNLQAFDEQGRKRDINITDAVLGVVHSLRSPNEMDSNGEVANVVDAGFAIARAIDRLAEAVENMSSAKATTRSETPKSWEARHRISSNTTRGSENELKAKRDLESRFGA